MEGHGLLALGKGPVKGEKEKNITEQEPERKPSMNSVTSVFTIVPVIPLKDPRENLEVTIIPG